MGFCCQCNRFDDEEPARTLRLLADGYGVTSLQKIVESFDNILLLHLLFHDDTTEILMVFQIFEK